MQRLRCIALAYHEPQTTCKSMKSLRTVEIYATESQSVGQLFRKPLLIALIGQVAHGLSAKANGFSEPAHTVGAGILA